MLSNKHLKLINQLNQKKYRQKLNLFIAEGIKSVSEFLDAGFEVEMIFSTEQFRAEKHFNCIRVTQEELKKLSNQKSPNEVLAIFRTKAPAFIERQGLTVVLDNINDPGNLGTIIRMCDWFGVDQLVCSPNTVDCYNPKVVQSSMGSLARLPLVYTNLTDYLKHENRAIYGTFLNGTSIYAEKMPNSAVIVMGNEANGISTELESIITNKITIPAFGKNPQTESLNVAVATAIILSEFKRSS